MAASRFKIALIQCFVSSKKAENLTKAVKLIAEAAKSGARLVALPECFNCPYGTSFFPEYAEPIPGESTGILSKAAQDNKIYLVGGSIPERDGDKIYNTCTVYNPAGEMIGKHRKMHLFNIDIPGKFRFQESDTLTAGSSLTIVETSLCKLGIGICYDVRFADLAQLYARKGCQLLVYPGAFNMTTGPDHWELLSRARALDNQCYVAMVSPAREEEGPYTAWGHSLVVSPWGKVLKESDHTEQIIYEEIDLDFMKEVRSQIPITVQRREDVYELKEVQQNK